MGLDGDDLLIGGPGDDVLNGGEGADVLRGGADSDVFVMDDVTFASVDTVEDFVIGEDEVDLTALFDTGGGTLSDYVQYDNSTGILEVDADGPGLTESMEQVAVVYDDFALGTHPTTVNIIYDDGTATPATDTV